MPFSVVFLIGRNLQPGRGVMQTRPAYLMIIRLQSIERRLSLARLGARLSGLLTVFCENKGRALLHRADDGEKTGRRPSPSRAFPEGLKPRRF